MFRKIPAMRYASKEVYVVGPNDNMMHVRKLLMRNNISRVVVIDGDERPVGIISVRDVLEVIKGIGERFGDRDLDEILVKEVMSGQVITAEDDSSVKDVCVVMSGRRIGSVPLVDSDDGRLLAIFTKTDAARAFSDHGAGRWKVNEVMRRVVTTVNRFQSMKKLLDIFTKQRADVVIVVDNDIPVGVVKMSRLALIDEFQLLSRRIKRVRMKGTIEQGVEIGGKIVTLPKVEDIMTPIESAVGENDDLAKATSIMLMHKVGGVPVVNDYGELVGLVTKTDIVDLIARV